MGIERGTHAPDPRMKRWWFLDRQATIIAVAYAVAMAAVAWRVAR